ncbi:sensor histidine kinase [Urechidicola vernalis]|uniref:histidine kinase n=1 Tax=Urechidicola vernalis TaxID=3075600 RepID=A0ABU2Y485_9FLAO|nr:HAMP domain-containing sensor histidine kinase [Urechidicola sp. P050]MDT0553013.1 HAMP domain-containing sensor histidine kinase [Urechidicola sp. P050]
MTPFSKSQLLRGTAISVSFIIVSLILWNTYTFFQKFKTEERQKMEILAKAYERLGYFDLEVDTDLELYILENYTTNPMIETDKDGEITIWANVGIDELTSYDSLTNKDRDILHDKLQLMKNQNEPIKYSYHAFDANIERIIYYQNSELLQKLTYYPITLILILVLFTSVIFFYFKSSKTASQNKLWTGMAKETAHQIGTPLSSLLGWIELLRLENTDETIVSEIEKDVIRLNVIAERFSKIGSIPELEKHNIVKVTKNAFAYLESRSSKQVNFSFITESEELFALINLQLFGWVIENLVKNAIDSMKGKGAISIEIKNTSKEIQIFISDTGKGIPKSLRQRIFTPGFTTKKRGWGLGLSLSKRIVEEYHDGKIFVKKSEINKGSIFCINLRRTE